MRLHHSQTLDRVVRPEDLVAAERLAGDGARAAAVTCIGGYIVTSSGRVFAVQPKSGIPRLREKSPHEQSGYLRILLHCEKRRVARFVHVLVAEAFLGPRPPRLEVRHLDGIRDHNDVSNLAWGTREENCADQHRHGTALFGERASNAKLTEDAVVAIRHRAAGGERARSIARAFGVHCATVNAIVTGACWPHVAGAPVRSKDPARVRAGRKAAATYAKRRVS